MKNPTLYFSLGFIGHKAEKFKALFGDYSEEPNEYGFYLKFTNFSEYVVNEGVMVETNCFESESHFTERLYSKLLHLV